MLDCVTVHFIYLGQCLVLSQSHCPVLLHVYLHLNCLLLKMDGWMYAPGSVISEYSGPETGFRRFVTLSTKEKLRIGLR